MERRSCRIILWERREIHEAVWALGVSPVGEVRESKHRIDPEVNHSRASPVGEVRESKHRIDPEVNHSRASSIGEVCENKHRIDPGATH
jgi:hypothetical protein